MSELLVPVAVGLGFAYCSAPGAVNAESLRRGLAHGPWAAVVLQLGSIVGDLLWAALAFVGIAVVLQDDRLRAILGIGGGLLLLWFAYGALRTAWRPHPSGELPAHPASRGFVAGVAMATVNPWGPIFWLGVGGGLSAGGALASPVAFLGSFFLGTVLWAVVVAIVIALARRLPVDRFFRVVDLGVGLAFGWFALSLFATAAEALVR